MTSKKKIIGYTVGSFDMFHIGHLNILKKSKEMCDELIVGLNTDETILKVKGKTPVIPFEERKLILESIKYVDKVIKVESNGKYEKTSDWELRKSVDILFSGDDHKEDPDWKELNDYKNSNGTKVVFFQYTKTTSSTLLKKLLLDRL